MTYWQATDSTLRLTDRSQVKAVQPTTFVEAQPQLNFILFKPDWLPDDCQVAAVTLRPEQPPGRPAVDAREIGQTPWTEANPCSVRAIIEGDDRRLRIKQFLYDWAPPAASTAPLWGSPFLKPFSCQGAVGWLGRDYMNRSGVCVQLSRTQIELSVEGGSFSDDELIQVCNGLTVADPEHKDEVGKAPFHRLSYWVRYQQPTIKVPHGLWRYQVKRQYQSARIMPLDQLQTLNGLPVPVPSGDDWVFDSGVYIEEKSLKHREIEVIFRRSSNHNDHLWMVALNADSDLQLPLPPDLESHPAEIRTEITLHGKPVWYAAVDPVYGAWEAFWQTGHHHIAVWAGSSLEMDGNGFLKVLSNLKLD